MLKACSGDRVSKVVIEDFEMVYAGVKRRTNGDAQVQRSEADTARKVDS